MTPTLSVEADHDSDTDDEVVVAERLPGVDGGTDSPAMLTSWPAAPAAHIARTCAGVSSVGKSATSSMLPLK